MLLECKNCGAPIDAVDRATSARCPYCGTRASIRKFQTTSMKTPEGWAPPPTWTPQVAHLPREPLVFRPIAAGRAIARWLISMGMMFGLACAGFIGWRAMSTASGNAGNAILSSLTKPGGVQKLLGDAVALAGSVTGAARVAKPSLDGTVGDVVPVVCTGNQSITITGKTLTLAGAVPVLALGNCHVRLVQCTLNGASAVMAKGNAKVIVEGGALFGTGTAVVLSENATFQATSGTRLIGEPAVALTNNARATLHDASITSTRVAITASGNASADVTGSTVTGRLIGRVRH